MIDEPKSAGFGFGDGRIVQPEPVDVVGELVEDAPRVPGKQAKRITAHSSEREIKHAAVVTLAEGGMSYKAIADTVGVHYNTVRNVVKRDDRHSLASPEMKALAHKTVKSVMKGWHGERKKTADGTLVVVKDDRVRAKDALKAAEMIAARTEPAKGAEGTAPGQTFINIDLRQYREGT